MSFAIILCITLGAFAQDDKDKKPKEDGPKIVVKPKGDEKPKENPPKDPNKDKPKKPSTIFENVRKDEMLSGILKILIG